MKNRKILSFSLALMLIFTLVSGISTVSSAGNAIIKVENLTAKKGETVTVSVIAENVEEARNLNFKLTFDEKYLEYIPDSFKQGENMPHPTATAELKGGSIEVSFEGDRRTAWDTAKCVVATFDFKVSNDAQKSVKISLGNVVLNSTSGDPLIILPSDGTIIISTPVEEIVIDNNDISIPLGRSTLVLYNVLPAGAEEDITYNLTWESSNESVATVDANGSVTAVSFGSTVITVTAQNGIKAACNITVIAENDSMLPFTEISLKGGNNSVVQEVALNIAGPFPLVWTAYSNDAFIYVTLNKKYEVAYTMTPNDQSLNKFTILCDPTLMPKGTYTGTVTVVCGNKSETIFIEYTKTTGSINVDPENDPFQENPYRKNIALEGVATGSSTFDGPYETTDASYTINGEITWPRWASVDGVWEPNTTAHWLTIDLRERKSFDKVSLFFLVEGWARLKEFKVLASNSIDSNNPEDWFEIKHIKNNSQEVVTIDFEEITYRYVRLYVIEAVQDRSYKNCARVTQFKIFSKTEYPYVEPTDPQEKMRMDLTMKTSMGVFAKAQVNYGAFGEGIIDVLIDVNQHSLFSDEFIKIQNKFSAWLGYEADFMLYDINAKDSEGGNIELLEGEKMDLKVSIPGGFDPTCSYFVKINPNGTFEMLDTKIEEAEEKLEGIDVEVSYCIIETDYFGQYIIVEDLASPRTNDINQIAILSTMLLSVLIAALVYRGQTIKAK